MQNVLNQSRFGSIVPSHWQMKKKKLKIFSVRPVTSSMTYVCFVYICEGWSDFDIFFLHQNLKV